MKKKLLTVIMLFVLCVTGTFTTTIKASTTISSAKIPTAILNMNDSSADKFELHFDANETLYSAHVYIPFTYSKGTCIELRLSNRDEACIKIQLYDVNSKSYVATEYLSGDTDYDKEFGSLNSSHKYYFKLKNCSKYSCRINARVF